MNKWEQEQKEFLLNPPEVGDTVVLPSGRSYGEGRVAQVGGQHPMDVGVYWKNGQSGLWWGPSLCIVRRVREQKQKAGVGIEL